MSPTPKSPAEIQEKLRSLRLLRFICHFPWLMVFLLGASFLVVPPHIKHTVMPIYQLFFFWAFVGFFLSFFVRPFPCPRCGEKFHFKRYSTGLFSRWAYNDFARKCMHCGLKLDGSNL